jgi:hypothetical protein
MVKFNLLKLITFFNSLKSCCESQWLSCSFTVVKADGTCFHAGFLLGLFFRPWRWRRYVPLKLLLTPNGLHGLISQKMVLLVTSAVRTSNPTWSEGSLPKFRWKILPLSAGSKSKSNKEASSVWWRQFLRNISGLLPKYGTTGRILRGHRCENLRSKIWSYNWWKYDFHSIISTSCPFSCAKILATGFRKTTVRLWRAFYVFSKKWLATV